MAGKKLRELRADDVLSFELGKGMPDVRINGEPGVESLNLTTIKLQSAADARGMRLTIIQLDTSDGTLRRLKTVCDVTGSASLKVARLESEYLPEPTEKVNL